MADLRLEYPYLNLAELAAEAADLTRSAVNHRLRRLVEAADGAARGRLTARIPARPSAEGSPVQVAMDGESWAHGSIGPPVRVRTRRLVG